MDYENLFISDNLPKSLTKEELYNLFKKYKNGDINAREEIINRNINLVLHRVWTKYINNNYEKKDLVSIGLIGLIKSVDTFDVSKNIQFSTYATRCVDNEILMYFRKYNKTLNDISLNESITPENHEENKIELKDTLEDINCDFVSKYEQNETILIIRKIFNKLPETDKYIIGLYFGFFNDTPLTQREIALKLNISLSKTCRIINKILKEIKKQLETEKLIELPNKVKKRK